MGALDFLIAAVRHRCVTSGAQLFLLLAGDAWIATCYLLIPRVLLRIINRLGGHVTRGDHIKLGAAFILACGVSHALGVASLFFPALDWLRISWLLFTGAISTASYVRLVRYEDILVRSVEESRALDATVRGRPDWALP